MKLEHRFHEEMIRIYEEAGQFGYYPTYFLRMVNERGGVEAAKQLLKGNDLSDGLTRLWEEGRLVLQEPWRALFTNEELEKSRGRLEDLGYAFENGA